ncbi:carbohydrate-binding protein [Fibrobacter sp. HC4]|uniref:carbohydrate-binding protein n=1 Tax=Fibrobacter sp. HC4 TaxID=3239812 RepID=UPI0020184D6A|nr:carbohydrate-binding protein [Fibrobacter succinogenes]MCL4102071.1 hypothetical protein [Fibrobacter succinogenes]
MGLRFSVKGALAVVAFAGMGVASAATSLSVNLGDSIRPVTHVATGSLYGLTETYPLDIDKDVAPLKPNVFLAPARSGQGRQQPIGGAFLVSPRIKNTTGKVQIRLADILPGWPYRFKDMNSWKQEVTAVVNDKKASEVQNFDGYEIWNEPNDTWKSTTIDFNSGLWKQTYDLLRQLDPKERIVGPSYSWYNASKMEEFVKYCSANNCMPDVISWHQWGSEGLAGAIENYRNLEKKYNVTPRAISINEYSSNEHLEEGCPGVSVPFIAKFERHGVESAMISWWFTNLPGRLGSLLTAKNERGGGWHLYKWYGDMSGYMAKVTPPNDKSDGVDGFAAVDVKKNFASIVVGGNTLGDVTVDIAGVPAAFGSKVNVAVEYVTWKDKDTAVPSTTPESSKEYTVSNGKITVPIKITNVYNAYRIYVTPIIPQKPFGSEAIKLPGKIQAENYDVNGSGENNTSYYDADDENKGNVYREDGVDLEEIEEGNYVVGYTIAGEWLEYTVDVDADGEYPLTIRAAAGGTSGSVQLFVDGKAVTDTVAIPQTADNKWDVYENVDAGKVTLTVGEHIIKLAITGSYANIDWFMLGEIPQEIVEQDSIESLKEMNLRLDNGREAYTLFDMQGNRVGQFMAANLGETYATASLQARKSGVYIMKSARGKALRISVKK